MVRHTTYERSTGNRGSKQPLGHDGPHVGHFVNREVHVVYSYTLMIVLSDFSENYLSAIFNDIIIHVSIGI
jgi:hypothetical protein